jgi:ABC-2 type transport system permease protein
MNGRRLVALVARREIRERLRSRAFLVATLFLLVAVGASPALNGFFSRETTYRIAVVAPAPPDLAGALERAASPFGGSVRLRVVASSAAGRRALDDERVDALLLLRDDRLVFRADVDHELAAVVDTAVRTVRRHLPPEQEVTVATLELTASEPSDAEVAVALFGAVLLLTALAIYGQWVLVGVVEEKSNRVVELILSAVPPRHMLAGKVIGIGLVGLGQLVLVAGLAAVLLAAGAYDAPTSLGRNVLLVVPWFGLGFALYAVAYAAAGALASRQQDASAAGQPITITLVAAYFVGYAVLADAPNGALAQLLTVIPVTAPLVLPARSALVGVPLWEHALAVVLTVGAIYVLVRLAGRVYAHGLLRSGPRLGARAALRLTRAISS